MRLKACLLMMVLHGCLLACSSALARENKPVSWACLTQGPIEVELRPSVGKHAVARLGRGALVEVLEVGSRASAAWSRVRFTGLGTFELRSGWIESNALEVIPLDRYPDDAGLLKLLGGQFLEDFTASHTGIARYLLYQGGGNVTLVCFIGSPALPISKLQAFRRVAGILVPDAHLDFPYPEMQAAISWLETRDVIGDGNECLITREAFNAGPEHAGVNFIIRRIENGVFKHVWDAPIELQNLESYPPRMEILKPPEKNIGAAGTVTRGQVEFHSRGKLSEPVWKGKVEFHVVGREGPIDTITIEKVCAWDGTKFAPLR